MAHGMDMARDLGNMPGNLCTPTYLGERAKELAVEFPDIKVTILERKECEELGMGSFLSVTNGSDQPPRFIVFEYMKSKKGSAKPCVLVGKGITFDTGGISIKPATDMDQMKFDMCGAASVFGTLRTIAELKAPVNVVGLIPACENMPSGRATKPGDVVTSMSGQTIEVLNTDAEGRLIWRRIDVRGTLRTRGGCRYRHADGRHGRRAGTRRERPFQQQRDADARFARRGRRCLRSRWQLPMWEDYQEGLATNFADFANVAGRAGGSITAACFLSRFTKKYDWAHLDIAGTAWKDGKEKGATGRPVALLATWLLAQESAPV
jgi:leucyl aminopeptidase